MHSSLGLVFWVPLRVLRVLQGIYKGSGSFKGIHKRSKRVLGFRVQGLRLRAVFFLFDVLLHFGGFEAGSHDRVIACEFGKRIMLFSGAHSVGGPGVVQPVSLVSD